MWPLRILPRDIPPEPGQRGQQSRPLGSFCTATVGLPPDANTVKGKQRLKTHSD